MCVIRSAAVAAAVGVRLASLSRRVITGRRRGTRPAPGAVLAVVSGWTVREQGAQECQAGNLGAGVSVREKTEPWSRNWWS